MYSLEIMPKAEDDLARLDISIVRSLRTKLNWLCENCETLQHEALQGMDRGKFRWRVRDYRIIYSLDRQARIVVVHRIGHRSSIY